MCGVCACTFFKSVYNLKAYKQKIVLYFKTCVKVAMLLLKNFFFEYEKGLCVLLLLKIIVSMKRVMRWFFTHMVTFKRLLLVRKGVMCMFGG